MKEKTKKTLISICNSRWLSSIYILGLSFNLLVLSNSNKSLPFTR